MPSCPTLPTSRQLADQLGVQSEELCAPDKLPSLLVAVRTVPDPRAPHLVTHPLPMLLGLVACALLCGVRSVRGVIRWAHGQGLGDQPFDRIDGLLCLFGMYKAVTDSSDDVGAVYRPGSVQLLSGREDGGRRHSVFVHFQIYPCVRQDRTQLPMRWPSAGCELGFRESTGEHECLSHHVFQSGSFAHNPLFDESSVGYGSDRVLHLQAKRLSFAGVVEGGQEAGQQIGQGRLV
jgi:hypothetical protein